LTLLEQFAQPHRGRAALQRRVTSQFKFGLQPRWRHWAWRPASDRGPEGPLFHWGGKENEEWQGFASGFRGYVSALGLYCPILDAWAGRVLRCDVWAVRT